VATKGRIQVVSIGRNGEFIVQGTDLASTQLLSEAVGRIDGLEVRAAWPRRRGGRDYPKLKLTPTQEADRE